MLLLGLILIVVGIVLLVAVAHPAADLAGWVLVALGLILVILAVVGDHDIDVDGTVKLVRSSWSHVATALAR